jgi:hypothetical protein
MSLLGRGSGERGGTGVCEVTLAFRASTARSAASCALVAGAGGNDSTGSVSKSGSGKSSLT